jgi:subtilase family serine protease
MPTLSTTILTAKVRTALVQVPRRLHRNRLRLAATLAAFSFLSVALHAQTPQPRLAAEIDSSQRVTIPGTHPPLARPEFDAGRVPSDMKISGATMVFTRSAAQEAGLQSLIAAQQDPHSPQYHKWLTPDEFAARFGIADADISKVAFWLQQQGFSIDGPSRGKTRLSFSGTAQQVESAFATELHYYNVGGVKHYAPAGDLSVPAALAGMVQTVSNLSTFRPKSHAVVSTAPHAPSPNFTSSQTGSHFLSPADVATIYDITPAYNAGFTGSGQTIAVVGQSSVVVSDIENFQKAAGLPVKDPTMVLVPGTGTAALSPGDEMEADIDIEYSGAIAKGATIKFVFVGNSTNSNVFNALVFAIDNNVAPVISISFGSCESDLASGEYASLNGVLSQASAQGQSVTTADGDNGSTDCSGNKNQTTAQQEALAVDFPSSSQFVTAMGGTEFPAADVAIGNTTFWAAQSTVDIIGSALSYIPEMVWNDDQAPQGTTPGVLSSGGGGTSTLTPRPTWQTGVPGIPSGSFRLLPDVSLAASPNNAGYLYCSSDTMTKITGSCTPGNGFRDNTNTNLTVAGGTSFDAPIFAGMIAIVNQKLNSTGQGVVNPILYQLAGNAATYASAFHDITTGNNECTAGATLCSAAGMSSFAATTGYDEASGLGSVDFNNLLNAWAPLTGAGGNQSFTLAATNATVADGSSITSTITVTPQNGFTGTLAFTVSASPALTNGCFTLPPNLMVSGATAVTATLTILTSSTACASAAVVPAPTKSSALGGSTKQNLSQLASPWNICRFSPSIASQLYRTAASLAFVVLFLVCLLKLNLVRLPQRKTLIVRSRGIMAFTAALLLAAATLALSGCGGSSSPASTPPTSPNMLAAKGTYTLTITATDTASASTAATTTAMLVIN